jgi:hypothetical protein
MGIPSKLCLGFSACIACGTQQHLDVGRSGPALAGAVSRAKPDPTDVEHGDSGMFDRETAQQANVAGAQPADPGANGESTSPQIPGETIEDPTGRALDRFYAALRRTEGRAPSAVTRVLHMGDSSIGLDG